MGRGSDAVFARTRRERGACSRAPGRATRIGKDAMKSGETLLNLLHQMSCGALLLNRSGNVVRFNQCAERCLIRYQLAKRPGSDRNAWATEALKKLFRSNGLPAPLGVDNDSMVAVRLPHGRPVVAHRILLTDSADYGVHSVLLLIDLNESPGPNERALQELLGLTAAEARLAVGIGSGKSLKEVAADQQIRDETARTHLKRILHKTHTHRQGELVAVLTRLAMIL